MSVCPICRNERWLTADGRRLADVPVGQDLPPVRPCPRCRESEAERHKDGAYMPTTTGSHNPRTSSDPETEPGEARVSVDALRAAAGVERQPH